ncbi:hypothetical protein [Paenibacillus paridis]|nr:hypothetical protein [Paenibacillus paridis]
MSEKERTDGEVTGLITVIVSGMHWCSSLGETLLHLGRVVMQ